MRHRQQICKPRNMDNRDTIKLTNLIQDGKYYDLRHAIYSPKGCAPTLTAAMGMGEVIQKVRSLRQCEWISR